MVLEEISFEEFQDGGHLGYPNRTILAILNLHVSYAFHLVLVQSNWSWLLKNFKTATLDLFVCLI